MSVLSLETLNQRLCTKFYAVETAFIADTSFLFCALDPTNINAKLAAAIRKNIKERGYRLLMNVTAQHELRHLIQSVLVEDFVAKATDLNIDVQKIIADHAKNEGWSGKGPQKKFLSGISKSLLRHGFGHLVATAMGKNGDRIDEKFKIAAAGCEYLRGPVPTDQTTKPLTWENVNKLMSEYALDSSDAMILNTGLSNENIRGLLSMDSDFRYIMESGTFDIFIPDNYTDLEIFPVNKVWQNSKLTKSKNN